MPDAVATEVQTAPAAALVQVVFLEVSAKRLGVDSESQTTEMPLSVQVGQSDDNSEIMVRVSTDITSHQAVFRVDVMARYSLKEPRHFTDVERKGFANSGPMLTLIPFLREALLSSALRLGVDGPMVPLFSAQLPGADQEQATDLS